MRFWLHTYAPTTAVTPSAVLSVAAHAMLIGAAVYGTGKQASELAEEISQRVYYLPPPDRTRASEATVERIQYVDVGNGARVKGVESPIGTSAGQPVANNQDAGRGAPGTDLLDQPSQSPFPSPDSVYSILNVEETAVRSEWSAAPIYPMELIQQAVEGSVLTNFVIDTTGRADTNTIEILQATHPLFAQSVRTAIPDMRFSPAMVQGHKVRQVVEQRFQFRIAPPVAAPAEHTRTKPVP
jgi:TonB family protein